MTLITTAFVRTDTPARYISRLCKHFAHKLPVSFDEHLGRIEFPLALALLQSSTAGLTLQVRASTTEELHRIQQVVASHFERVAWQAELTLTWL